MASHCSSDAATVLAPPAWSSAIRCPQACTSQCQGLEGKSAKKAPTSPALPLAGKLVDLRGHSASSNCIHSSHSTPPLPAWCLGQKKGRGSKSRLRLFRSGILKPRGARREAPAGILESRLCKAVVWAMARTEQVCGRCQTRSV